MILLTDEEIEEIILKVCQGKGFLPTQRGFAKAFANAQAKKTLISVGKESTRLDGTIYLVPDYVEYRKALKGVGLE